MLPQSWDLKLVDLNVAKLSNKDLLWADFVFLGGMVVQQKSARYVISRCADLGVRIVAGGPLFTCEPEKFGTVDHLVLGEAEMTLPLFLADLERGTPKRVYTTDAFPDIQQTPVPRWDLLDLNRYGSMNIQFSRGCPYDCEFCNITSLFGHRPRTKSAAQVIAELDGLYALGWRGSVFFVDDNFIGNRKRLKQEVLPALIEWRKDKAGFPFNTEVSINLADDQELMDLMFEAGFNTVFVGIETPDEESLAECNKFHNRGRDLVESVKRIQRSGMQVQGGFIVGFDSDTPSIFQRQIDFIQKSGIVTAMVGLLQAPTGTKLYQRMLGEGRILNSSSGDNVDGSTNIVTRMNLDTLREGYRLILDQIYSPKLYYERLKTFLREYKTPKIVMHIDLQSLLAFPRSIYRIGIRGAERLHYWRLLVWTLFARPRLFSLMITMAIYGYHFRQVCEEHVL
jgi:radical SAM superfamily enzyme YgiQ (UPF0313 family)